MRRGIAASARHEALRRLKLLPPVHDSELDDLTALAALACDVPMAAIALVGEETAWFASRHGAVPEMSPSVSPLFVAPVEAHEPLVVPDTRSDAICAGQEWLRMFIGVPLVTSRGYVLGTLAVMGDEPREQAPRVESALRLLARRIVQAMERREPTFGSGSVAPNEFEQAPFGYLFLDGKGCIHRANATALRLLGYTREELVGERALLDLLTPESAERCRREVREVPVPTKSIELECEVVRKDGRPLPILLAASITRTSGQPAIAGAAIVELGGPKSARGAPGLHDPDTAANRRLVALVESMYDGFVAIGADWRYSYVNRRAAEMFGRTPEDLLGKNIWEEFPEGRDQPFYRAYVRAFTEQVPLQIEQHYQPWDRWFENRIYPFEGGISIFFTEITERKRAEAELVLTAQRLRALSARLETVREEEAARIAQLIHDDLGQALTVLKMDIAWLGRRMRAASVDAALLDRLGEVNGTIDGAIVTVRSVAAELRPNIDGARLVAAMETRARDIAQRAGLTLTMNAPSEPLPLEREGAAAMHRIAQEAMTNIVRHARATSVTISLRVEGDEVVLDVVDDGVGVDLTRTSDRMGVMGMNERARSAGGTLVLERTGERGTRVTARIPRATA